MEDVHKSHSLRLFGFSPKNSENAHLVRRALGALATMLGTRFETRRRIATMSAEWLREHEANYYKHR